MVFSVFSRIQLFIVLIIGGLTIALAETAPPTDVSGQSQGTSTPGFSLMLILAFLGGLILVIGFVTPVPEAVRRRNRR